MFLHLNYSCILFRTLVLNLRRIKHLNIFWFIFCQECSCLLGRIDSGAMCRLGRVMLICGLAVGSAAGPRRPTLSGVLHVFLAQAEKAALPYGRAHWLMALGKDVSEPTVTQ